LRFRRIRIRSLPLLALALWCLAPAGAARGETVTYIVDVNTTSLSTSSGYIDFQFNPADSSSLSATAVVNNFSTDGSVGAQAFQQGDATGPGSGPFSSLSFDNGTATNELTYAFTYGMGASFDVILSQATVGGSGSTFSFSLLDTNGNLLSDGPATVTITINSDGSTTGTAYPPIAVGGPTATVTLATVPEPSTMVLGGLSIAALLGWCRVRRSLAA
jgi:hypothetical protein